MDLLKHRSVVTVTIIILVLIIGGLYVREEYRENALTEQVAPVVDASATPDAVVSVSQVVDAADAKSGTAPTPSIMPKKAPAPAPLTGKSAPDLQLPSGFSNTEPFKLQELVGKNVIVISFQNYTTINSLRATPYFNKWFQSYRHKGLSVITVHTPRFAFDRAKNFVDQTAFAYRVLHPIVLDNQYATANAWGSKEWPTTFLVDISGKIVATYRGEGSYEAIEARIQQLLIERSNKLKLPVVAYLALEVPEGVTSVNHSLVQSPETYFGATKNTRLGNGVAHRLGIQDMKPLPSILLNTLYLTGSWEFTGDYAKSSIEQCSATYRYNAKNVYAVFGSLKMTKVFITLDGAALGSRAGKDVREEKGQSYIFVTEERVYDIVKGDAYGEHTIVFTPETPGLEAYTLMFG